MEIDALSDDVFVQRQVGRIAPALGSAVRGVHTYSRNAAFEAIDILTPRVWSPGSPA
jgi:hypothetical protein